MQAQLRPDACAIMHAQCQCSTTRPPPKTRCSIQRKQCCQVMPAVDHKKTTTCHDCSARHESHKMPFLRHVFSLHNALAHARGLRYACVCVLPNVQICFRIVPKVVMSDTFRLLQMTVESCGFRTKFRCNAQVACNHATVTWHCLILVSKHAS